MSRFRILIVDDEPLSRTRLRRLIALDPDCELVGECVNGAQAVTLHRDLRPDVIFLDVHMPEMDGFAVLRAIAGSEALVILASAHGEHAVKAFESAVFDYLLKPFGRRRFHESLQRAKARILSNRSTDVAIPPESAPTVPHPERIAVRSNGTVLFLKLEEVDWFEAADNYVLVHRGRETFIIRATMADLESKLNPAQFLRVHRSSIVNLDRIKELRPWFRGDYLVVLRDGTELTLTKTHRENLESRLLLGAA